MRRVLRIHVEALVGYINSNETVRNGGLWRWALVGMKIDKMKMTFFFFLFILRKKRKLNKRIIGSTYP